MSKSRIIINNDFFFFNNISRSINILNNKLNLFIKSKKTFAIVLKENNKVIGSIGIDETSIEEFVNEYPTPRLEATSKKVIKILNKLNFNVYENYKSVNVYETDYENLIILESDFEDCVKDLKKLKLGTKYKALISWLVSTTFKASECDIKGIKQLNKNKCLLLRVLYEISPETVINVFKKKGKK